MSRFSTLVIADGILLLAVLTFFTTKWTNPDSVFIFGLICFEVLVGFALFETVIAELVYLKWLRRGATE